MKNKSNVDFFDKVREQLRYWPYTIHQIDDTLDIGLIEGRAKQLLFRGINEKNTTAFIGSGISAAYGRLTWREWEEEQQRVVKRNVTNFLNLAESSLKLNSLLHLLVKPAEEFDIEDSKQLSSDQIRLREIINCADDELLDTVRLHSISVWIRSRWRAVENARRQVSRLNETFKLACGKEGDFPGGEELPVKFEIAQQLHSELNKYVGLFLPEDYEEKSEKAIRKAAWPGALVSHRNSAPVNALKTFRKHVSSLKNILGETYEEYLTALENYRECMVLPEANLDFEQLAKSLLVDECPHAYLLLRKGLLRGKDIDQGVNSDDRNKMRNLQKYLNVFDDSNLKRNIDGIRDNPKRYRVLTPFRIDKCLSIVTHVQRELRHTEQWTDMLSLIHFRLSNYVLEKESSGDKRQYITPSSRFLVPTLLSLCENPFLLIYGDKGCGYLSKPEKGAFTSRRSIIADRFDPLAKTVRMLGVSRFITTNYDFEIERFFQDRGYRNFPSDKYSRDSFEQEILNQASKDTRSDSLGGVFTDQTFARKKAYQLTEFSIANDRLDASVYHLHGRATKKESLVITERDYMELYLTQDKHRSTVDEGIYMAFSSSTLLFLGLGMGETDLLRPLRQFISNRDRAVGYTSIALLPADRGIEARTKFSSALYLRYGVHTIFYGSGVINISGKDIGIDWLFRMLGVVESLKSQAEEWKNNLNSIPDTPAKILENISGVVDKIGPDLAHDNGLDENVPALKILYGVDTDTSWHELANKILASGPIINRQEEIDLSDDSKAFLRTCFFTPIRPKTSKTMSNHYSESDLVDGAHYLGMYTSILSELVRMALKMPQSKSSLNKDYELHIEDMSSRQIMLDGLHGALITGASNAALEAITLEHRSWWKNWQESPPHRLAKFQSIQTPASQNSDVIFPRRYLRHRVNNVISNLEHLERKLCNVPFIADEAKGGFSLAPGQSTRIRSFDTFIKSIVSNTQLSESQTSSSERQIFTVAANRGLGKGTFMSAFSSDLGLSLYREALWRNSAVNYCGAIFINLSFSPEISSVFDMLSDAILSEMKALSGKLSDVKVSMNRFEQVSSTITGVSRLSAIRKLFLEFGSISNQFYEQNKGARKRLLVNICATELFFDSRMSPKNGEIALFINLLFSKDLEDVPVDFVFVGSEDGMGSPWSDKADENRKENYRIRIDRKALPLRAEEHIARREQQGHIKLDESDVNRAIRVKNNEIRANKGTVQGSNAAHTESLHYIHYARPVSAVSLLLDNFPVLATSLYLVNPPEKPLIEKDINYGNYLLKEASNQFRESVESGRKTSDQCMLAIWRSTDIPTTQDLHDARQKVWKEVQNHSHSLIKHAELFQLNTEGKEDLHSYLYNRLHQSNPDDLREWRSVHRLIGGSRFAITILLAAAEHIVVHHEDAIEGGKQAQRFIRETIDRVRNIGHDQRDRMVLESCLESYRKYHIIGHPDLDSEFHLLLIRHLGVIGTPIGSAVFVRLPEIRIYFERVGIELEVSRRRFLVRALTVMAYRGLVFRLDPHPNLNEPESDNEKGSASWSLDMEYRYALHRVVQRLSLLKLGISEHDPKSQNSFAPTVFAAMPSVGPRLSRETYLFLRSLLIGLSQYPDVPTSEDSMEQWLFTTEDKNIRVQALRAALTLARSTLSVAVVSRLGDFQSDSVGVQKRGYFETYKVRLRWIIRMAWDLLDYHDNRNSYMPDAFFGQANALYKDEIVWIYNELGVVALAQGSLSDSLGYLRQAAEFNQYVEGKSNKGPIYNHINLNHAVVQLERGQLLSARSRLNSVIASTAGSKCKLYWLAKGYLCVLDHITGKIAGLESAFRKVTREFQKLDESRAAAIFLNHFGILLAASNSNDAKQCINLARDLAETGGHEDIRYRVELNRIKVGLIADGDQFKPQAKNIQYLRSIEAYGRQMGVWSLQCDALRQRAIILLAQGETTTAGRLLIRSMSIAKKHSMALRLNSAMTVYAETLLLRGDNKGARNISKRSLEMAKMNGYNLETSRAEKVLSSIK